MGRNKRAFTLIELLVVILIIAILAAIALPQYQKAADKARAKAVFPVMRAIVNAENLYRLEHGDYTETWAELGLDIPYTWRGGNTLEVKGGMYLLSLHGGTYPYVTFIPSGSWVMLYAAFPIEHWLCYPQGTTRGKALCKSLGCRNVEAKSCDINPSR